MGTKLYRVRTTKDNFMGYSNVEITWIALGRPTDKPPVRYAYAIEGLSADVEANPQQEQAVDELFNREEAEDLVAYLRKYYPDERTEIVEVPLPLRKDIKGFSHPQGLPLRKDIKGFSHPQGMPKLEQLKEKYDYPFSSFSVWGYPHLPEDG
jgi:hypothetical protein